MFGETLTVTLGGSGGTAVVLNRINQDNYSAEYLKKRTDDEIRVKIRHSTDQVKAGTQPFDRHNVLFEQFVYPTAEKPLGVRRQMTFTMRISPYDSETDAVNLAEALTFWADSTNLVGLFGSLS